MEKRRLFNTKTIAVAGVLTAIEIILQVVGNFIAPGLININLGLIPIVIGAVLYGPLVGGFLGLVCGAIITFAPSTISFFFAISPIGTIITCLLKTTLAGVLAGLVMKLFKGDKKRFIGVIIASFIVPFVNTALFALFASIFFMDALVAMVNTTNSTFKDVGEALFLGMIGANFIFEVITTMIIAPSIYKVMEHQKLTPKED